MKKLMHVALSLTLCSLLCGCNSSTTTETKNETTPTTEASKPKPELTLSSKPADSRPTDSKPEEKPKAKLGPVNPANNKPEEGKKDANGIVTTASGLKYQDVVVGKGASPIPGSQVVVHYTGTLLDGTKFDSSVDKGQPFSFNIGLHQVIEGWDEGVMSMKVGGKRKLIIPPALGYKDRGMGPIPPNSTLLFDVELLEVH